MILEPIRPQVLAVRCIPKVDRQLAREFSLAPHHTCIGLITCTIDDCLYAALDEGTKAAEVDVVYAKSFYAGAAHASGPFSGEIIGVFASHDPEEVSSALQATKAYLEKKACFYSADEANRLGFFPHVIPSVGRYLARQAKVDPGTPMAYLIAPPIEAVLGLDAALKAAEVEMKVFYAPPSETNFAGGLLVGDQPSVEAAAQAFQDTILELARSPQRIDPTPRTEALTEDFGKRSVKRQPGKSRPYRILASGLELDHKPHGYTHLFDNQSLVPKTDPVMRFRGKMDLLQADVVQAGVVARSQGCDDIAADLHDVLVYLRKVLSAEVTCREMPQLTVGGFTAEDLHRMSHNTQRFLGVGWVLPDASMGPLVACLNRLRASSRDLELAALDAFGPDCHLAFRHRDGMLLGLNRLSSALYVLVCKAVGRRTRAS